MKAISVLAAVVVLVLGFRLPAQGKAVPQGALVRLATPAITVTPNQGKPEQTFTVQGTGFACHNGTAVAVVSFDDTAFEAAVTSGVTFFALTSGSTF